MNLLRRTHETELREPRLLDSRTPGVAFEMTGSIQWKPRRASHLDIEAVVCDAVFCRAQAIAIKRYADDIRGAQDAINAELGYNRHERTSCYSRLIATVTLRLNKRDMANSLEYRNSVAQIERLRFLRKQLYSDPSMLLLDYLDKNPEKLVEPPDLAKYQQLALRISSGERWWCQVLEVLDKLSSKVSDQDGNSYVLKVFFASLKEAAPDLFDQHQLEKPAAHDNSRDSDTAAEFS
jgi:hypothetical protein